MEGDSGSGSAGSDEWGSAVASDDATKLAKLVLIWSRSKPEPALLFLRVCAFLLEKDVALSAPASSPLQPPPTSPDEWGLAVTSGDATKLAELVLVWSDSKPKRALSLLTSCISLMEKENAFSAPTCSLLQWPLTTPGRTRNSCLDTLIISLSETCNAGSWYTSTKELQLASLEFCITCRSYQTIHLKIDAQVPRRLLAAVDAPSPHPNWLCGTRVPRLRARRVTWNMPTAGELKNPIFAITNVDYLEFGDTFKGSLTAVAWPRRLQTIDFGDAFRFNKPIDMVEWPASLQRLAFGSAFNQPIEEVVWPTSLKQLTFEHSFNQPIQRAAFPACLEQLAFGQDFNQPIESVSWPDSLQKLNFGLYFNRPIDSVRWPASLQEVCFGNHRSSEGLALMGSRFNQRVDGFVWPASMRRLTLGHEFRQSLQGLGTWMPNLETLRLLDDGSSDHSLLRGMEWPAGLRHLTVFEESNLDGVVIPSTVMVYRPERV